MKMLLTAYMRTKMGERFWKPCHTRNHSYQLSNIQLSNIQLSNIKSNYWLVFSKLMRPAAFSIDD